MQFFCSMAVLSMGPWSAPPPPRSPPARPNAWKWTDRCRVDSSSKLTAPPPPKTFRDWVPDAFRIFYLDESARVSTSGRVS